MVNRAVYILCVGSMLAGCASIMSPSEYSISLSANVKDVKVAIYNRDEEVEVVTAPTEVKLSPKAGFYVPAKYRFVFEKEGFSSDEVLVDANFNWWFAANFLTWGFVVGVFLDPATGAMWQINETSVIGSLKPRGSRTVEIKSPQSEIVPNWIFQAPNGSDTPKEMPRDGQSVEIDQIPL